MILKAISQALAEADIPHYINNTHSYISIYPPLIQITNKSIKPVIVRDNGTKNDNAAVTPIYRWIILITCTPHSIGIYNRSPSETRIIPPPEEYTISLADPELISKIINTANDARESTKHLTPAEATGPRNTAPISI